MITKYDFAINDEIVIRDINRLTNQLWKLIPMRENDENWLNQLDTVIIELIGLKEILYYDENEQFLILISKLEGIKNCDIDFMVYRKTVFEAISLLREFIK